MLRVVTYLLLVMLPTVMSAQVNKANRLFEAEAWSQAARLYEQVLERNPDDVSAMEYLAHCYRHEKRFEDAMQLYQKVVSNGNADADLHFHLAEMHYLLGDYSRSDAILQALLVSSPDHARARRLLAWSEAIKAMPAEPRFEIVTLHGINSPYADFSPVVHNAGLVFTTERKEDSGKDEFAIEHRPFTNLYYAPFSNERQTSFWTPELFARELTTRYHDGPACFSSTSQEVYFTRVERMSTAPNRSNPMRILVSRYDGNRWSPPKVLPFSDGYHSVAHPALQNDSTLVFSSDMDGGRGGMDLYISRLTSSGWSTPVNLGPAVNSEGDEVFPHVHNDWLYFSSNAHPGYGGLDIFRVHLDSLNNKPENMGMPVNSAWDDLSITFVNENKAYFSSDRPGGKGRDDIYGLERIANKDVHRELSGILEYDKQPSAHTTLYLKDEGGNVLQETTTNQFGKFSLSYLHSRVPYTLSIDALNNQEMRLFSIYLLNDQQQKVQKIISNDHGDFKFELLPPDDHDNLELIEAEDVSLLSIDIHALVFEHEPGDFNQRIEVLLLDANGNVLTRTFTRRNGRLLFRHLFPDDQYVFRLLADNPNLQLAIVDEHGNVLKVLGRKDMDYIYQRIGPNEPVLSVRDEYDRTLRIAPKEAFSISNIYYALDAYLLNEAAKQQLNRLVALLQKNPNLKVHVMSHTDSRASDAYNLKLSERRAGEVLRYLREAGIAQNRLKATGFGEQRLINHCKNNVPCSEEEHARNRRTEFAFEAMD
ncbi:MAG: hypothetical protein EA392_06730 [Cryomorphaceae bacterium]|nr:MAG: hypothetical protein EA392_06730 [Cryomorphaceae bacterium]